MSGNNSSAQNGASTARQRGWSKESPGSRGPAKNKNNKKGSSAIDTLNTSFKMAVTKNNRDSQIIPLTTFHLFSNLPEELRRKIWQSFILQGRIIEMEWGRTHQERKIATGSRLPPPILQVCREAREEGLFLYRVVKLEQVFTWKMEESPPVELWTHFCPASDIVYFGEKTCMCSLIWTLLYIKRNGISIQRVALNCSGAFTRCGDYSENDEFADYHNMCVPGGVSPMQALHGIEPHLELKPRGDYPGCPGLKEVILVQHTSYQSVKQGEIQAQVGLRPAVGPGKTKSQRNFKANLEKQITDVAEGRGLQLRIGENKWVGNNLPEFSFMSLCPLGVNGKLHDSVILRSHEILKVCFGNGMILKDMQKRTDCQITPAGSCRVDKDGMNPFVTKEIGFYGTRASIEKAKDAIRNHTRKWHQSIVISNEDGKKLKAHSYSFIKSLGCLVLVASEEVGMFGSRYAVENAETAIYRYLEH